MASIIVICMGGEMEVQRSSDPGIRGLPRDTLDTPDVHEMPQNPR